MESVHLIFMVLTVGVAIVCAVMAARALKRPRSRRQIAQAATLGVLAGLAPISVVLFLRLSYKACTVLNVLGLPWSEPWREIAHWGGGAIWLASTAFLIVALRSPHLRPAGVAMGRWSLAIAFPTFLLYFMTVYGDPAPNCVPV